MINVDKFFEIYFRKICEYVDADYDKINFYDDENWYKLYTWTNEDEISCAEWLCKFLTNNPELKKQLIAKKRISSKDLIKYVEYFIFEFGWNCNEESIYIKKVKRKENAITK